jgi:hypothetical protein
MSRIPDTTVVGIVTDFVRAVDIEGAGHVDAMREALRRNGIEELAARVEDLDATVVTLGGAAREAIEHIDAVQVAA